MKNRIIAALLILVMLFGITSCEVEDKIPPKDHDLIIETDEVVYTDEDVERLAREIGNLAAEAAPVLGYPAIGEDKKSAIANEFKSNILPILKEIPVYASEIDELITGTREVLGSYSKDDSTAIISLKYVQNFLR